jgi:ABC-type transport system involved in multi-copper enzyme maturation permease subunit
MHEVITNRRNTYALRTDTSKLSYFRVFQSELIKLKGLRSAKVLLILTALTMIASGVGGSLVLLGPNGGSGLTETPVAASTLHSAGLPLAQLLVGALGVLFIATEFAAGSIRVTFTAVPTRTPVIIGKAVAAGVVTFVISVVGVLITGLTAQVILSANGLAFDFLQTQVLLSGGATALYLSFIAIIGVSLGTLLRSTAGGIVLLVILLSVLPGLTSLIPLPHSQLYPLFFPAQAGSQMIAIDVQAGVMNQWQAGIVMALWPIVLTSFTAIWMRRRDV